MKRSTSRSCAVPGIPLVRKDDDLVALIGEGLARGGIVPRGGDVFVLAQKMVSKAEGRMVDLATVVPSAAAIELAGRVEKDPRLVEVILSESVRVVRARPNILIVEHRLGFVMANAGVDQSNVASPDGPHRACCCRSIRTAARKIADAPVAAVRRAGGGDHQRQLRSRLAPRHLRSRGRCGGPPVADGSAWLARSVRPRASGQHHRPCG